MARGVLSVVLPIYNERENLAPLFAEIEQALAATPHEVIAVDDASTDGSLQELHRLARDYPVTRVLALAERSGQSAAFAAGFATASGDVIATIDADGQNDPADLPRLLATLTHDAAVAAVAGYRVRRADGIWKRFQSRVANAARNVITGDRVRDTGCSLKVMRRTAVAQIPRFHGMHRFLVTLIRYQGARVVELPVAHRPRRYGGSKYGMWDRLWRGIVDAIGVRWLGRRRLQYRLGKEHDQR